MNLSPLSTKSSSQSGEKDFKTHSNLQNYITPHPHQIKTVENQNRKHGISRIQITLSGTVKQKKLFGCSIYIQVTSNPPPLQPHAHTHVMTAAKNLNARKSDKNVDWPSSIQVPQIHCFSVNSKQDGCCC